MTGKPEAVCVVDCRNALGEGPVWDAATGALHWVDIVSGLVQRLVPATGERAEWRLPERVSAAVLRQHGGLLIALASGFAFFDPISGDLTRLAAPEGGQADHRLNDAKCDRRGRFWAGAMNETEGNPRTADLYRLDPDLSCRRMESGIGISNGIAWSPDDAVFYFADTAEDVIYAYDFDIESGAIANRRVFAAGDQPGGPDGATVDAEGYLWSARWGGSRLVRYAPDGRVDRVVPLPVSQPTSCAFGGPNLTTLYVTSAAWGLDADELAAQPQAGGLLALDVGVKGLSETRFAG